MSTKNSLELYRWNEPQEIHIYYEWGEYYIENAQGQKFKLTEKVAVKFAEALKELMEKEE